MTIRSFANDPTRLPLDAPLLGLTALLRDDTDVPRRVIAFRRVAAKYLLIEQWVTLLPIAAVAHFAAASPTLMLLIGSFFAGLTTFWYRDNPVSLLTRYALAIGLLINVLLLIYALNKWGSWQLDGGHMWIFAVWSHCLALLCWRSLAASGFLGVLHHFLMIYLLPVYVFPDGANIWRVALHGGVVVMQLGVQIIFIFLIFRMLWLAENLERSLGRNADKLEDMNAAKSRFLAMMSHELRTPLNAIIGFSELVREEMYGPIGNDKYLEYLGDIHSSGKHLLAIINDILDLSKVEAGKIELEPESIAVEPLTKDCLKLVVGLADQNSIRFSAPAYNGVVHVVADSRLTKQMLVNLLSNACKYTPKGGEIGVTWAEAQGVVSVTVIDTGIGMSVADMDIALQPFGQVNNPMIKGKEGTGLGLPLVKALIEAHGGRFDIQSRRGVGTAVTLAFPRAPILAKGVPIAQEATFQERKASAA
jgi:signal transduction histidine kinase